MNRLALPWVPWLIVSAAAGAGVWGLAAGEKDAGRALGPEAWVLLLAATAPLLGAQLVLGVPSCAERVRARLREDARAWRWVAGGFTACFVLAGLAAGRFDPYATAIVAAGAFGVLGALRAIPAGEPRFTWIDALAWLVIWIPFDLRWSGKELWQGPGGFSYNWWAVALSVFAVLGWGAVRDLPGLGYRLVPRPRDVVIGVAALLGFAACVIPVGLAIDFLHWPPSKDPSWGAAALGFLGLFLTVAIPEELFFRGLLQNGLERTLRKPWHAWTVSALAFGLMHWNNVGALGEKIAYCALATVAGLVYGWAYRRSGSLLAAVLTHTLTDLAWGIAFK